VDDAIVDGPIAYTIVTGAASSSDPAYNTIDPADVSVTNTDNDVATADLVITKTLTSTPPFVAGGTLAYEIVVSNNGPAAATNVIVTDVLPAGTTFVSATPSQGTCSGTSTVVCTIGSLPDDASATIQLTIRTSTTPGTVTNTASVMATEVDGSAGDNASTAGATTTAAAELTAVPTLSEWMLIALAAMLAVVALVKSRV
jgi:uncharacterized repeat protein (TIGR01451 family)